MRLISNVNDMRQAGRAMLSVKNEQMEACLQEAEMLYIKPVLGSALYNDIINKGLVAEPYHTLYNGGIYEDAEGETQSFVGLRVAISYFVYAQNVMSGDFHATRYGMVRKDDDYSQPLSDKNRSDAYNNALEIGNLYLKDCVDYCKAKGLMTTKGKHRGNASIRIRKLG